jgi:hypothetical protein
VLSLPQKRWKPEGDLRRHDDRIGRLYSGQLGNAYTVEHPSETSPEAWHVCAGLCNFQILSERTSRWTLRLNIASGTPTMWQQHTEVDRDPIRAGGPDAVLPVPA